MCTWVTLYSSQHRLRWRQNAICQNKADAEDGKRLKEAMHSTAVLQEISDFQVARPELVCMPSFQLV